MKIKQIEISASAGSTPDQTAPAPMPLETMPPMWENYKNADCVLTPAPISSGCYPIGTKPDTKGAVLS